MKIFGLGILLIMATFQLMGCAHVLNREATLAQWRKEADDTRAKCADCTLQWDLAQQWVRERCKTGIKEVTDSLIETNPPGDYSRACIVRKRPTEDGQYTIDLELKCRFAEGCMESNVLTTRKAFNQYVNKGNAEPTNDPPVAANPQQPSKPPEPSKETVKPANNPSKEPPDNIKKEIRAKCASDFPSDYAQQAECVKRQEAGWMELNH